MMCLLANTTVTSTTTVTTTTGGDSQQPPQSNNTQWPKIVNLSVQQREFNDLLQKTIGILPPLSEYSIPPQQGYLGIWGIYNGYLYYYSFKTDEFFYKVIPQNLLTKLPRTQPLIREVNYYLTSYNYSRTDHNAHENQSAKSTYGRPGYSYTSPGTKSTHGNSNTYSGTVYEDHFDSLDRTDAHPDAKLLLEIKIVDPNEKRSTLYYYFTLPNCDFFKTKEDYYMTDIIIIGVIICFALFIAGCIIASKYL